MITDKDIIDANEKEKFSSEAYLKGIVDFVKWSSTLAVAAILWIGNFINSTTGLSWIISLASLLLLLSSLIVAILAARSVLMAWAIEWDLAREQNDFVLFKKWKTFKLKELKSKEDAAELNKLNKQEGELIDSLIKSVQSAKPFSKSKKFNSWIKWHIFLLVIGLLAYVVAQFLSVL
jgi:hypothetical protein